MGLGYFGFRNLVQRMRFSNCEKRNVLAIVKNCKTDDAVCDTDRASIVMLRMGGDCDVSA